MIVSLPLQTAMLVVVVCFVCVFVTIICYIMVCKVWQSQEHLVTISVHHVRLVSIACPCQKHCLYCQPHQL
jgi:hypothetical protein